MEAEARLPDVLSVDQIDEDSLQLSLHFHEDNRWFSGHFPGLPLFPGLGQVALVSHFARTYLSIETLRPPGERIKFMRVIQPNQRVQLALSVDRIHQLVNYRFHDAQGAFSSGRFHIS